MSLRRGENSGQVGQKKKDSNEAPKSAIIYLLTDFYITLIKSAKILHVRV